MRWIDRPTTNALLVGIAAVWFLAGLFVGLVLATV
jgi:hypothetical protein